MNSGGSIVAEPLTHDPKIEDSMQAAPSSRREKMALK
jgi:hypothetical protein